MVHSSRSSSPPRTDTGRAARAGISSVNWSTRAFFSFHQWPCQVLSPVGRESLSADVQLVLEGRERDSQSGEFLPCMEDWLDTATTSATQCDSPPPSGSGETLRLPGRPTRGRFRLVEQVRPAMGARGPVRAARFAALPGKPSLPLPRFRWSMKTVRNRRKTNSRDSPREGDCREVDEQRKDRLTFRRGGSVGGWATPVIETTVRRKTGI